MSHSRSRVVLAGVVFVVLFAQVLLYPGIDLLVRTLGARTSLDASMWFLAVEFAAFVAFAGVWGLGSDAVGKRLPFVVGSALAGSAGYLALAHLPTSLGLSFSSVLALRAFQGAATVGAFSLAMTMLMDLPGGHGRNMGAAGIAIGLGTALGAPVGGQLYELGALVPLYAAAVLVLAVAPLSLLVTDRVPAPHRAGVRALLSELRETKSLVVPYLFGFVDRLTAGFFALVGTLYFREVFGLSPLSTGLTLALFFAPFALLQYPFGRLSDRIGRAGPMIVGSVFYGLTVVGVGVASSITVVRALMVAVGVLGALMAPATMALVTDLAPPTRRGVAMAGFNASGSAGFLTGIVLGGTVAGQFGFFTAFVVVGGLELLVALAALPAVRRLSGA